jgi:hypothetical protein
MKLLRLLLLVLMLCPLCASCAASAQQAPAALDITLLEDPQGTLRLEDAIAAAGRFRPGSPNVGGTTSAYWMRFKVHNPASQPVTWWFDTGNRTLQEVDFYQPDSYGGWQQLSTGSRFPFVQRPLPTDTFVFPLTVAAGATVDVYLRVRSTGYLGVTLLPRLWTKAAFLKAAQEDRRAWLTYLGVTGALGVFYLMLWLYLREHNYLLYVLSMASIVWSISSTAGGFGAAFQLFWPNSPGFEQCSWMLSQIPVTCLPVLFASSLVDLPTRAPRVSRLLWRLIKAVSAMMVLMVVLAAAQRPGLAPLLQGLYLLGWFLWLPVYPLVGYAMAREAWRGDRMARYFCLAYTPSIMAAAVISTQALRGLPPAMSAILWASTFELLVTAVALADYLNYENKEKISAQQALLDSTRYTDEELERKVLQRTLELNAERQRTQAQLYGSLAGEGVDVGQAGDPDSPVGNMAATAQRLKVYFR